MKFFTDRHSWIRHFKSQKDIGSSRKLSASESSPYVSSSSNEKLDVKNNIDYFLPVSDSELSSVSPLLGLPSELLQKILELVYLSSGSPVSDPQDHYSIASFSSLALVCKSFTPIVQALLFSDLSQPVFQLLRSQIFKRSNGVYDFASTDVSGFPFADSGF
jgi:hypothetical protein